jgi:hypothetical protein
MSEGTAWIVFLMNGPGADRTPGGSFASRQAALAWIAALPEHVRRRAMPPLPLPPGRITSRRVDW